MLETISPSLLFVWPQLRVPNHSSVVPIVSPLFHSSMEGLTIVYIQYMLPYLFPVYPLLLAAYKWYYSASSATLQPLDMSWFLCNPFFFRSRESDFESNSESRTTLASNWCTKIEVICNHQNKAIFHNLPGVAPPILDRWSVYRAGVH
jgi:hypothetical protein